jgi:hypothetical protein
MFDDAMTTWEEAGAAQRTGGVDGAARGVDVQVVSRFSKSLTEACLKHLCMSVEEKHLPHVFR